MWDEPYSPWNIKRILKNPYIVASVENSKTMTQKQRGDVWAVLQGIIATLTKV